jgi:translation initiation factor IF-3
LIKKPLINNQIRSPKVRVLDETEKQLGVLDLTEALRIAQERKLDLIQVTEKADPPVCKIMDYGKYLYWLQKKEKGPRQRGGEVKGIRLTFNISSHDLETRAKQAEKFLKEGDKIRIEMILRGREKAHFDFARDKVNQFIEILNKIIQIKEDRELRREPRGFSIIIGKK